VSLTNHAANISTSSPAVFSAATANIAPATALPESKLASVAPLPRQNAYYVLSANQRSPRFPYSTGDKFRLFVKDTVDPFALMGEAATALYNQAKGDPRAYGGGARGYSRRFGAIVGTDFAGEFFGTFLFSSLLHTDPRYFRIPAFVIRRTADPLIPAKLQKQAAQPSTPGE